MQRSLYPTFAFALLCSGCLVPPKIEAQKMNGAWVFSYARSPTSSEAALQGGQAAVVDGCLQLGDSVVVWQPDHLDTVDEVLGRIDKGEKVDLWVGGGGLSLDEGSTVDDFPDSVREHCSPSEIFFAGDWEIEFEKPG